MRSGGVIRSERSWFYFIESKKMHTLFVFLFSNRLRIVIIYYGDIALTPRIYTNGSKNAMWFNEDDPKSTESGLVDTDLNYSSIPPESRICVTLYAAKEMPKKSKLSEFVFGQRKDDRLHLVCIHFSLFLILC